MSKIVLLSRKIITRFGGKDPFVPTPEQRIQIYTEAQARHVMNRSELINRVVRGARLPLRWNDAMINEIVEPKIPEA